MKKQLTLIGSIAGLILFSQIAYSQNLEPLKYKPDIQEDEIIVCVQDVSDNETIRHEINCKIYIQDGFNEERNITLKEIAEDLYKNPFNDTFEMGLID